MSTIAWSQKVGAGGQAVLPFWRPGVGGVGVTKLTDLLITRPSTLPLPGCTVSIVLAYVPP